MRVLILAALAVGTVATALPARAQAWDPAYPVCLRVYGPVSYNECRYTSLGQCAATASGRPAQCVVNPYFASAEAPLGRHYRRHRHVY